MGRQPVEEERCQLPLGTPFDVQPPPSFSELSLSPPPPPSDSPSTSLPTTATTHSAYTPSSVSTLCVDSSRDQHGYRTILAPSCSAPCALPTLPHLALTRFSSATLAPPRFPPHATVFIIAYYQQFNCHGQLRSTSTTAAPPWRLDRLLASPITLFAFLPRTASDFLQWFL